MTEWDCVEDALRLAELTAKNVRLKAAAVELRRALIAAWSPEPITDETVNIVDWAIRDTAWLEDNDEG